MIKIEDLQLTPSRRENLHWEELRRASDHLDKKIIRSARVLCNTGMVGYDLSVIEALALLRSRGVAAWLVNEADNILRMISGTRSPRKDRVIELLEDVVRVSNGLEELCVAHEATTSRGDVQSA